MKNIINQNASITITCPECNKKSKQKFRWLQDNNATCPNCGVLFKGKKFAEVTMKTVDESFDRLREDLRKFGK